MLFSLAAVLLTHGVPRVKSGVARTVLSYLLVALCGFVGWQLWGVSWGAARVLPRLCESPVAMPCGGCGDCERCCCLREQWRMRCAGSCPAAAFSVRMVAGVGLLGGDEPAASESKHRLSLPLLPSLGIPSQDQVHAAHVPDVMRDVWRGEGVCKQMQPGL